MSEEPDFTLLPYSYIVGQDTLRDLLAIDYVMRSSVGGVLVSGDRGTAKSTIVRSFARMMYGWLPVTLPINVTDDRVVGGWDVDALMLGKGKWREGLLVEASKSGMLYIDEVNLLDDHIVNLILDVVSTGVLVVERDGKGKTEIKVDFSLVGTMNPDEGLLRPQLLDRFGFYVGMMTEEEGSAAVRAEILKTVLRFDAERDRPRSTWLADGASLDKQRREQIEQARGRLPQVELTEQAQTLCATLAAEFKLEGHRGEIVMAQGARACAALAGRTQTTVQDVGKVAWHAMVHRRKDADYADGIGWTGEDEERLAAVIASARPR
jgi:magnesium chelatase subunit I